VMRTHLHMRVAFASLFAYRCALNELEPSLVNGIDKALENANTFADEVVAILSEATRKVAA
jgi:chromosome partitioning protein